MDTGIDWKATIGLMRLQASYEELKEAGRRVEALRGKASPAVRSLAMMERRSVSQLRNSPG